MRSLFSWWPWRRRPSERPSLVLVGGTDLDLLRARLTSAEKELRSKDLLVQEQEEELVHLSREVARLGLRADQLQERVDACRCAALINLNTKGRA